MTKKNCILTLFLSVSILFYGQNFIIYGKVVSTKNNLPLSDVEIYNQETSIKLAKTNSQGEYIIKTTTNKLDLVFISPDFKVNSKKVSINDSLKLDVFLTPKFVMLDEIDITDKKQQVFGIDKLKDVEENSIYAGKKSEVISLTNSSNLSTNNARQIYSQISGLNIYQNDDAGLQLNIGGRGLDPNRTSNFNTRQNGYDISADVLGYPESYYTPPAEALEKIEIVRGAASLQYGTQFGGMLNFVIKKPNNKKNNLNNRLTFGSNGLITTFNSFSTKTKNIGIYSFFNFKKGDGFRKNSSFNSKNFYFFISNKINKKIQLSAEFTYFTYLAQQAGGLNDEMFDENPFQSNRARNWFSVNWFLYNLKFKHKINNNLNHTISIFSLSANRNALGFRSNRVDMIDYGNERDLIYGDFRNYGIEHKLLNDSKLFGLKNINLLGYKIYQANNSSRQGPGSSESDANFNFENSTYPYYANQSQYKYPNSNFSIFGENILYLSDLFSIVPGFRYEYINTNSDGQYQKIVLDGADNPVFDTIIEENRENKRKFVLFGLGISYKINNYYEFYSNISQNYRSVTFADISIVNPAFIINPDIKDENGYTSDIGLRGNFKNLLFYDLTTFFLKYNDRIGFIQKELADGRVKSERGNVGDANIYGFESLINLSLNNFLDKKYKLNIYSNLSFIESRYVKTQVNGVLDKKVEFIPKYNFKTGLNFSYNSLSLNFQYTYLSEQFTDASNSVNSNLSGVLGIIPQYDIVDLNFKFERKAFSVEAGVNNVLNNYYFTRRATGYPGPGIIPSLPRNYFTTLSFTL